MHTAEWLKTAAAFLTSKGIQTARLDCLLLLEDTLQKDRAWLLAHPEYEMSAPEVAELQKLLSRRATHEPMAQLRGRSEFYGRPFVVSKDVLEPRPESETMIDLLKELCVFTESSSIQGTQKVDQLATAGNLLSKAQIRPFGRHTLRIGDVGTGSGCLGITASLEVPGSSVDLIEIDPKAATIAQTNVDLLTSPATVISSDLLADTPRDYHVLLCNLPYVPDGYPINQAAGFEPAIALFGGPDGLDLYRKLFKQISASSQRPLYILTEALPDQHAALTALAAQHSYQLDKTDDFIQQFSLLPDTPSE